MRIGALPSAFTFLALLVFCATGQTASGVEKTKEKPPAVTSPKFKDAKATIRDLFKEEFKNRTPESQLALSQKLLSQAQQTSDDPVARYVLFVEAHTLATDAGNLASTLKAISEMSKHFEVDVLKLKTEALKNIAPKIRTAEELKELGQTYLALAEEAVANDDYLAAGRMITEAQTAARKGKDMPLMTKARKISVEIRKLQAEFNRIQTNAKLLKQKPDDPKANLEMGKYHCFIKGNWEKGIPHLKRCADAELAALAALEEKGAAEPKAQVELGDGWYNLYEKERNPKIKTAYQDRALHWYRMARKKLTGISSLKVTKRMSSICLKLGPPRMYLADHPEKLVINAYGNLGKNGDLGYEDKKVSIKNKKYLHSLSQHAKQGGHTRLVYQVGMRFKTLAGSVGINDTAKPKPASAISFKILGDGKEIWASKPQQNPGASEPFQLDISGVEELELQVHCPGANAYGQAVWMDPLMSK